jgi:PEP-CTERM motif
MKMRLMTAAMTAAFVLAPAPAQAQACASATTMTSFASYVSCAGAFTGNLNGSAAELTQLTSLFSGTWAYLGKSDDANFGPFAAGPSGTAGTLTFDASLTGQFIIGIKAGSTYSFYRYNALTGILSMPFETIGTSTNQQGIPQNISHAALYRLTSNVVPEPSTYALFGTGLLSLGFFARRRRNQG